MEKMERADENVKILKRMDTSNIEILNDDCLLLIFQALPLEDKLKIGSVCRRWQYLSPRIFCRYKILVLDSNIIHQQSPRMKDTLDLKTFMQVLKQSPEHLKTVDLTMIKKTLIWASDLRIILESCPNIQELYLTYLFEAHPLLETISDCLKPHCTKLKKFGYAYNAYSIPDENLYELLASMENLEHLFIDTPYHDEFLWYIPTNNIEELIFEKGWPINLESLCKVFEHATKLHTICMSGFSMQDDNVTLPQNSPIKNLALTRSFQREESRWSNLISQLSNIEQLSFQENYNITDEFLIELAKNCKKITFLNIMGCRYLTDDGIANCKLFPNLRHLSIAGLSNIKGTTLGPLPYLEVLDCYDCQNITDYALHKILEGSAGLRILILSKCYLISDDTLIAADNFTRSRNNDVKLHMAVGSTKIKLEEIVQREFGIRLKLYDIIRPLHIHFIYYNSHFPSIQDFYDKNERIQI